MNMDLNSNSQEDWLTNYFVGFVYEQEYSYGTKCAKMI